MDIGVVLDRVVARDPDLYETEISGQVSLSGPIIGGPLLSGRVDLGETEFRIPSTGLGGSAPIPDINHVGDTRPVRATRAKAGLEPYPSQASSDAGMAAPPSTPRPIRRVWICRSMRPTGSLSGAGGWMPRWAEPCRFRAPRAT